MSRTSLWTTPQQRRQAEDQAELYAILRATEKLEFAYARDAVDSDEYTEACQRLITQFKATEKALRQDGTITDTPSFVARFAMDCPRAVERLLTSGVPATILHGGGGHSRNTNEVVLSAEVTSAFITTMDTARMEQVAVDFIQPVLQDLMRTLNKADAIAPGFDRAPLQKWLQELNGLRAVDTLTDEQRRQLILDLDNGFQHFMQALRRDA